MASKNKVEVRIRGKDYTVMGFESEEYIQKVSLYIDKKMVEVSKSNDRLSTSMAAVLTAINVADDYFKNIEALDNLRAQVQQYLNELDASSSKLKEYKEENKQLRESIQQLQIDLAKKETELDDFVNNFDNPSRKNTVKIENARKLRAK